MTEVKINIDRETLSAQRALLRSLDVDTPEQVELLEGLIAMCNEMNDEASYFPIIQDEYLEHFARQTVATWAVGTLIDFATIQLAKHWSTSEGEEDLDTRLENDDYFYKRGGFVKKGNGYV